MVTTVTRGSAPRPRLRAGISKAAEANEKDVKLRAPHQIGESGDPRTVIEASIEKVVPCDDTRDGSQLGRSTA